MLVIHLSSNSHCVRLIFQTVDSCRFHFWPQPFEAVTLIHSIVYNTSHIVMVSMIRNQYHTYIMSIFS